MFRVENRWPFYADSVKIEWNIGKRCNLDCTYCPADIHDNFSPHLNLATAKKTIDTISTLKNVRVSLTGGEPCVHPEIEYILMYLKENVNWVNVTTNGTRKAAWYLKQNVDHYVFSLHVEDDSWNNRLSTIISVVQQLQIPSHVNLMAHHNHMDRVKESAYQFELNDVPFVIRRIRWTEKHDWFDDMKYNSADLDFILKTSSTAKPNTLIDNFWLDHTNDIIKNNKNNFKDWICRAGIESLMINNDGEVFRATCRVGGSLGNIYTGTFNIPKEEIVCTRNWCTCAADVNITKWKQ